jgi:glycosyltransferase involved in cell wall biosynthesis
MRVLYVIDALGEGGTEMSLAQLLPGLREAGVEPTVVCLKSRGAEGVEQSVAQQGFDVRVLRAGSLPSQVRQLGSIVREVAPDLIHTMLYRSNVVGRLAGWRTRVPVVGSVVNTSYSPERLADPRIPTRRMRVTKAIDGFTARRLTRGLHAVSDTVRDHTVETLRVDPEHITVIRRGRDPLRLGEPSSERTARARDSLGIPGDALVVVNVGRQEFQKGHADLLAATASLVGREPRTLTVIAGREGTASPALRDQVHRLGLDDAVRFLGHRQDVPEVLAAGDVFAFPSRYEGLPGALLEAMALALPIVAADIPSVREVVVDREEAMLVPASDPEAMADAVLSLFRDPARRRELGAAARARFLDEFVLERSVRAMSAWYNSVAGDGVHANPSR